MHDRQSRLEAPRKRARSRPSWPPPGARWSRTASPRCRPARRRPASLAFDPTAPARAMADFTVQLWSNPMAVLQASQAAASEWMELWGAAARRAAGQQVEPVIAPERGDRRFGDAAWSEDPVFDYLKQAYLLAAARRPIWSTKAEGIDEATRTRAEFYTQRLSERALAGQFRLHQSRGDPPRDRHRLDQPALRPRQSARRRRHRREAAGPPRLGRSSSSARTSPPRRAASSSRTS